MKLLCTMPLKKGEELALAEIKMLAKNAEGRIRNFMLRSVLNYL